MNKSRRAVRVLSTIVIGASLLGETQNADAQTSLGTVVIVGTKTTNYSSGYSTGFDGYMTNFFGGATMSDSGFSGPESEAYQYAYGNVIWPSTPTATGTHMKIHACTPDPRITETTRSVTASSEDVERRVAANQIMTALMPNFINTKKDGLTVQITFTDGSVERYRHTSLYGWQPIPNTFVAGNGVVGSACAA